jgi:hypothetical protein
MGLQKESTVFKKAEKVWKLIMKRAKDFPHCKHWIDDSTKKQFILQLKQNNKTFD